MKGGVHKLITDCQSFHTELITEKSNKHAKYTETVVRVHSAFSLRNSYSGKILDSSRKPKSVSKKTSFRIPPRYLTSSVTHEAQNITKCWIVKSMNELTGQSELNQPGQRELKAADSKTTETLEQSVGEFYEWNIYDKTMLQWRIYLLCCVGAVVFHMLKPKSLTQRSTCKNLEWLVISLFGRTQKA